MVSKGDDTYVVYPIYFDRLVSRVKGRRVPKKYAVDKPTLENIAKAAKALGLSPIVEKNAAHPFRPWRKEGRVLIAKKDTKTRLLVQIAKLL